MSDEQKNTIFRFAIIFVVILLGFAAVIAKIIYIQTVERDDWMAIADKQEASIQPVEATRGNILDCEGRLLASSMPRYNVYMDTRAEALRAKNDSLFYTHIDSLAMGLSAILGEKSKDEYKFAITKAYKDKKRRLKLTRQPIDYLQKRRLEKEVTLIRMGRYKGIYFESQNKRIKPFGNLASRTIGNIYGESGCGNSGLEKEFEKELHGKDGVVARQRIGGRIENIPIEEAQDGMDIVTTIEANLQDIVEQALRQPVEHFNAEWGCCILMETKTGAIKAISNLDRAADGKYYEAQNHAVMRVEPGSTFKTIALVAALDDGKIDIDDTVRLHRDGWTYINARHIDAHRMDTTLTVRSALAVSSNIAMAKIITHAYEGSAKKFVNRIRKMGLMDSVYCEIPGAQQARIDIPKDTVTLSKMAYGYSVELSPMQILMFYNAIANNGKMVRPMLVKAIQRNGETVRKTEPQTVKSSICSNRTLTNIQGALHDVVWDNKLGTASVSRWGKRKAQSNLVTIAGKTGTAQLLINGRYNNHRHRMTFVGYFPEEDPQYTCICMINDPKPYPTYDSGMDCGGVVRRIAEKTMAYTGCYVLDDEGQLELKPNTK